MTGTVPLYGSITSEVNRMRRKYWLNHLLGAMFAFLLSVSAVGCLTTGWELTVASPEKLLLLCGLIAVLTSFLLYFRYGWCGILLLSLHGAYVLWKDGILAEQIRSLAYTISKHFHDVYGWKILGTLSPEPSDLVLLLVAYLAAVGVSWCICCRKPLLIALPPVLVPLILCLITTDTLPDETYLCLLMFGIVLLLVTDWGRRNNPGQFAVLTLRTAVPAAAALALLFALNPQEDYVNHAADLQKEAATRFRQLTSSVGTSVHGNIMEAFSGQKLNLRNIGPKSSFTYSVMQVTASYDGTIYLRGRDYDIYTGTVWESSGERAEMFPAGQTGSGTVSIKTYGVRDVLYLPYYPVNPAELFDGMSDNRENTRTYSYTVSRTPLPHSGTSVSGCTDLTSETTDWAVPLVKTIVPPDAAEWAAVQLIGNYVRNSAVYDRSTSAMNPESGDFARWFLEESDTGYCVHFATAAAVLLRAAGIPARYVEGYLANGQANIQSIVTNQQAHAWVEYYDSADSVWRILEATPSSGISEVLSGETESEETEPEIPAPDEPAEEPPPSVPEPSGTSGQTGSGSDTSGTVPGKTTGNSGGTSAGTGITEAEITPFTFPEWTKTAVLLLLTAVLLPVQAELRMRYKQKQWNKGSHNGMALIRWKQSRRLARRTKTKLPRELDELALKAKFSQHTITGEELERFEQFRTQVRQKIRRMPWYRRLLLRWVFAE